MIKIFLFILLFALLQTSFAQFTISSNLHYLLKNGKPFFWLGDTGWELFHRLTREEADQYLKHRAEQGFTVIQAVVLAEFDGLHTPNAYGDKPLIDDDPAKLNEAYFKHVDYIIDKANEYNLNIGLLPTWGDKINKDRWGVGPEIFNTENAKVYGNWIGEATVFNFREKYKSYKKTEDQLTNELVLYQTNTDPYKIEDPKALFGLFVSRVESIILKEREDTVEKLTRMSLEQLKADHR